MKERVVVFNDGDGLTINKIMIDKTIPKKNDLIAREDSVFIRESVSLKKFIRSVGLDVICWFDDNSVYGWVDANVLKGLSEVR